MNIFSLMQGMGNVIALGQNTVTDSFIAPMFRDSLDVIPSQPMLQELAQHIPTLTTFVEGKPDLPEPERKIYLEAIASFLPVLQSAMPARVDNRELRFLFFWPLYLEANFLTYLRQRQPGALVILMYYTSLLFASESRYWFMNGWGDRLMKECYEIVDQSWMPAIQWPLSFLHQSVSYDLFADLMRHRQDTAKQAQGPHIQQPQTQIPLRQYIPGPLQSHEPIVDARAAPYPQQPPCTTVPVNQDPILYPHYSGRPPGTTD